MEVGKKYKCGEGGSRAYAAILLTPDENMLVKGVETGQEYLIEKRHFYNYVEVNDSVVRYVHWYRHKEWNNVITFTTAKEHPTYYPKLAHIKTDKVQYDG